MLFAKHFFKPFIPITLIIIIIIFMGENKLYEIGIE